MDDAKDALDSFTISGMKLELQNGLLHQAEPILGLNQKILQYDVALDFHL
jgi:hypothetical protein